MDADEVMVAAAGYIAAGLPWDAMEVMRRWIQDEWGGNRAIIISELQGKVKKPWE